MHVVTLTDEVPRADVWLSEMLLDTTSGPAPVLILHISGDPSRSVEYADADADGNPKGSFKRIGFGESAEIAAGKHTVVRSGQYGAIQVGFKSVGDYPGWSGDF